MVTDVTARRALDAERERLLASERAARADAERANNLKDEFLATLSHELRTPLNAIVGWAQLLQRDGVTLEDVKEGAESIERNAHVQTALIADLLDVSRITSGKLRLELEPVEPASLIRSAMDAVTPTAIANGPPAMGINSRLPFRSHIVTVAFPVSVNPVPTLAMVAAVLVPLNRYD